MLRLPAFLASTAMAIAAMATGSLGLRSLDPMPRDRSPVERIQQGVRYGKSGRTSAKENASNQKRNREKAARLRDPNHDAIQAAINALTNYERNKYSRALAKGKASRSDARNILSFKGIRERVQIEARNAA